MSLDDYSQLYADAGRQYGVDPELLMAQAKIESGGDPNAYNADSKASGIAQIIPATAKSLGVTDPTDPKQAIPAQARLMAENIHRYGDPQTALLAYHGGTDRANWGPKTKAYAGKVMGEYQTAQNDSDDPFAAVRAYQPPVAETAPDDPFADIRNFDPEHPPVNIAANEAKKPTVTEDVGKTLVSAPIKAIGAIPQIPAMAGNAIANAIGYVYGKVAGATPEQQNRLNNLSPFFTGNTPIDAIDQSVQAVATGDPGKPNPLTGGVLHDPQTLPGRMTNALIQGGIAGPAAGAGVVPSLIGGAGAQLASEKFPDNPLAPLIGGFAGYAVGKGGATAATPESLPADVANVVKEAENNFGIKVPSSVMTGGNNLVERLAGHADMTEMNSQINKTAADLIGANDSGGGHQTVNQQAFLDAKKNNGAAYQRLDAAIGNVPLDNHFNSLANALQEAGETPRWKNISTDIYSRLNQDGSISSSNIRDITGYGSNLRKYANSPNEDIAEPAQKIIGILKQALAEKATPNQLQQLAETNNKYKLMSDFEKTARESGAGSQIKPQIIRDIINKSYSGVNDYETPAKNVGNLLNTVAPKNAYESPLGGINQPRSGSNFLPNAELGASVLMGEPLTGLALKYTPKLVSQAASRYINSDWYRNKLLQNAGY